MTKTDTKRTNTADNKLAKHVLKKCKKRLEELEELHDAKLQMEITERKRAEEKRYEALNEARMLQNEIMQTAEKERQRIGQDLHDGIGQNLTAVTFLLEALRDKMKENYCDGVEDIDEIDSLLRKTIIQTRSMSKMLYPVEVDKNGLYSALNEMAMTIEKVFDVSCEAIRRGNFFINDNQTAIHLYYIAREAVTNAIKHGRAKNIQILLSSKGSVLKLIITDDGSGCKENETGSGMGLRIMKYRASVIGAGFFAGNCGAGGFEVKVTLRQ